MSDQIYCSVDLEFTGFDPSRDQILEIGFAFFHMTEHGAEIVEEWSQVFKPSIEVHPKILGLTGITQEELDSAPEFSEHREYIQSKLGDCIIVGHNPVLDVKFLEAYGIKLSGVTIDTLELVQFLLPTHHSYNLENLMHYFGIPHEAAHRALGDAKTTIAVLENLLRIYQSYSDELKSELETIISRAQFSWHSLLSTKLESKALESADSMLHNEEELASMPLSDETILLDPIGRHHFLRLAQALHGQSQQFLLVVPDSATVMRLWRKGLVHGIFASEDVFDPKAFEAFKSQATTPEELRFCLKVVVWQHTNWQSEAVLDLNISFFGGQFRSFIVGGRSKVESTDTVLCCDYPTLQYVAELKGVNKRRLVVSNLQSFEKHISSGNGAKKSWNSILYVLKMIYNPETNYGDQNAKQSVTEALVGTDLFFALAYMLLHRAYPNLPYVSLDQVAQEQPHIFQRLSGAAGHLKDQLATVAEKTDSPQLGRAIAFLDTFFALAEGRVKWAKIDEHNTSFYDQPLEIKSVSNSLTTQFTQTQFTETVTNKALLSYYAERLGLESAPIEIPKVSSSKQLTMVDQGLSTDQLMKHISTCQLPLVLVMPNINDVKSFYNDHYVALKQYGALFAQGYSGGGNKMFRNFGIKPNSILLATPEFIARQPHTLAAGTVIFYGLPELEIAHPYVQALLTHWQDRYPNLEHLLVISQIIEVIKKTSAAPEMKIEIIGQNLEEFLVQFEDSVVGIEVQK